MKRVRSEQIQSLVLSHLKKRNFTESETQFKANFVIQESIKSMVSRENMVMDGSLSNSVSLGAFTLDEYFTSFVRFKVFLNQLLSSNHATDIKGLLFPLFAFLYVDLILSGRDEDADVFYQKFSTDASLKSVDTNLILEELARVSTKIELVKSTKVYTLANQKFCVSLSHDSHDLLLRFCHGLPSLVLLNIINKHIHFNITSKGYGSLELNSSDAIHQRKLAKKEVPSDGDKENSDTSSSTSQSSSSFPLSPSSSNLQQLDPNQEAGLPEVDAIMWKKCLAKVSECKPVISDICVHRLSNSTKGMTHATFSHNGQFISAGFESSSIKLWDTSEDATVLPQSHCTDPSHNPAVDVSKVTFGCQYWNNQPSNNRNNIITVEDRDHNVLKGHSGSVYSTCFTHDGRYLLSASDDTTVRLWDTNTCQNKVLYRGHSYPVWCVSVSAMSLYFATGSLDRTARLWTTERTFPLRIFAGHTDSVGCVRFHSNCSYLATADRTIRLWDVASGKTARVMIGHWAPVLSLSLSPNGKYLASSGEDRRIRMWDIASGALIKEMRGHNGTVLSLDFSPDDSMLASCGMDGCLKVWNTRTTQTAQTRSNTDVDDPNLNPDLIASWKFTKGHSLQQVTFSSCNLLNVIAAQQE